MRQRLEGVLGDVFLLTRRFDEAEPLLRRQVDRDAESVQAKEKLASALTGMGRRAEAARIYDALLATEHLRDMEFFNLGVTLFRAGEYDRSAVAFGRLAELRPASRDAWFNYPNALLAAEDWWALVPAGHRLPELDPLNEQAALITARAHLEIGDEDAALLELRRIEGAPIHLEGLAMHVVGGSTVVRGRINGNQAEANTPLRIRFMLLAEAGLLGSETLVVYAPPPGNRRQFEVSFGAEASSYHYHLVLETPSSR